MRTAVKVVLLPVVAAFAMTFSAGTATAQETEVEFVDEQSGLPCDPCLSEGEGESHIVALPSGVMISTCHDETVSNTYHDGTGEAEWVMSAHGAPGCGFVNCTTGDEAHFPVSGTGELGSGTGHMTVRICIKSVSNGSELHCTKEVVGETIGNHEGAYSSVAICGSLRLEGEGVGLTTDIEALHHSE